MSQTLGYPVRLHENQLVNATGGCIDSMMLDLQTLEKLGNNPSPYGVIGDPISHSLSPEMQQAAFDHFQIPAIYHRVHLKAEEFSQGVEAMRTIPFAGWNCTVPHKISMLELCDELAASSKRLGSVNTVINKDGKLIGHNTDGIGWSRAIKEAFSLDLPGINLVVLGAGGASRAVVIQALSEGCGRVVIANRSRERGEAFAAELGNRGDLVQVVLLADQKSLRDALQESTLVVNCTSAGLDPDEPPVLTSKDMHPALRVFDTIYGSGSLKLREEASRAGVPWSDGLGMLLYQGAEAFQLWTGLTPPVDKMRHALITH